MLFFVVCIFLYFIKLSAGNGFFTTNINHTIVGTAQNENTIIRLTVQTHFCLTFDTSCQGH